MKLDRRERHFRVDVVRLDGQCPAQHGYFIGITPEKSVTDGDLLKHVKVTRVEINRALQVACGFFPTPLAPLYVTLHREYQGIVW
jgi:hypothetical protein